MGAWQSDVVVGVLKAGLEDIESVAVSFVRLLLLLSIHPFVENSCYVTPGPPRGSPRIFCLPVIRCRRLHPIRRVLTRPDARNSPPAPPCAPGEFHFRPEQPRHTQTRALRAAFRRTALFPRAVHLAEHGRSLHAYRLEAVGGQHE
jgi:hypothetical protein